MTLEQSIAPDLLAFRIDTIPYSIYVAYSLIFLKMSLHEGIWIPFFIGWNWMISCEVLGPTTFGPMILFELHSSGLSGPFDEKGGKWEYGNDKRN